MSEPTGDAGRSVARTEESGRQPGEQPPSRLGAEFLRNLWTANTVTVTVLAIALAIVIGGVLIVLSTPDVLAQYGYFTARPSDALIASWDKVSDAYANMFKGAVFDWQSVQAWHNGTAGWQHIFYPISETLTYAVPFTLAGLCVAIAFRGGLFNIGAQGQLIMGVILAAVTGFALPLPIVAHLLVALLAGAVGGLIWGAIPGLLKARTGAHEVITTIMLNYVALFFLNWLINQKGVHNPDRTDAISKNVLSSAKLPRFFTDPSNRVDAGIILALLVTAAMAWLLHRSTFGFELRAVGSNPDAARTAGMSVSRTIVVAMALSGALAGLAGASVVLGAQANALTGTIGLNIGFQGILVALLGRVRPWGVVLAALLFGALQAGGNRMQSYSGISLELVSVLQALIVLFVAAPALIRAIFALRAARAARFGTSMAKGW